MELQFIGFKLRHVSKTHLEWIAKIRSGCWAMWCEMTRFVSTKIESAPLAFQSHTKMDEWNCQLTAACDESRVCCHVRSYSLSMNLWMFTRKNQTYPYQVVLFIFSCHRKSKSLNRTTIKHYVSLYTANVPQYSNYPFANLNIIKYASKQSIHRPIFCYWWRTKTLQQTHFY